MSRQLERLPQMQRQTLAAPEPQAQSAQEANVHQTQKRSDLEDRNDERASREDAPNPTQRASQRDPNNGPRDARVESETTETADTSAATETRPHKTRQAPKTPTAQVRMDAALLQAMSSLPPVAVPIANDTVAHASASTDSKPSLQTIALSPQIQIITDPKQAPSNESLAEFAKSMGLDETTIQSLIANGANAPARPAVGDVSGINATLAHSASHASMAALQPNAVTEQASATAQLASTVDISVANLVRVTPPMAAPTQATPAAQGSASLPPPDVQGLPGALLPPMSAADLASIEQIQITIMPAAIAGDNATNSFAMPSTQDVLSLLTGELKEPDISSLNALFNEAGGNEQPADQQHSQSNAQSTPFAQVLSSSSNNTTAQPSTSGQATSAAHMSEVYDQLSDKLATEMAGRLHKQLSDGEWKMKFGLRPAHLGGVEIQLEMKDGKLDAVFRADNPLTRDLLQNSSQRLREALENFGIHAGQVHVGQQGGNAQQNASRHSANQPQVGDNSTLQVKGDDSVASTTVASNKANASLLDLYA